jgi:UDP-glucose 4-epimerase
MGNSTPVFALVGAFDLVVTKEITCEVSSKRAGDLPVFWTNANKGNKQLNGQVDRILEHMLEDACCWQSNHPNRYLT